MFGSILSAAGGIIGGVLGNNAAKREQRRQEARLDAQRAEDIALQREFAQNSIQWRVQDAKSAGLHPLAALGVSGYQYTPAGMSSSGSPADYSWVGRAMGDMGQAIDGARQVGMTRAQRQKAESLADAMSAQQLKHGDLENEILALEIASKKARLSQESHPSMPLAVGPDGTLLIQGQEQSYMPSRVNPVSSPPRTAGVIDLRKPEVVLNQPGHREQQAGSNPDYSFQRVAGGGYAPVRTINGQDPYEDDALGAFAWNVRNRLLPTFWAGKAAYAGAPPKSWLPKGYDHWVWHNFKQAWMPAKKTDGFWQTFKRSYLP